jgi:thiol-disulfide isomerase/thioredoxin
VNGATGILPVSGGTGILPVSLGLEGLATAGLGPALQVVLFWANWCGHCSRRLPVFERIAKSYSGKPVEFLTVCAGQQDLAAVADAAKRRGVTLPVGLDPDFAVTRRYAIRGFPVIYVIGKDGLIEAVHGRSPTYAEADGLENLETDLRAQLDLLLAGKTRADFPTTRPAASAPAERLSLK